MTTAPIERPRGFAARIDIDADAERIWRALTEAARLQRWCGEQASVLPRAGGEFRAQLDRQASMQSSIDVFLPPRRLRLIHLPGSVIGPAPLGDALVDDLLIEERSPLSIVRLLCSGFPFGARYDAAAARHQYGWRQALARLKVYLEKRMDEEEDVKVVRFGR